MEPTDEEIKRLIRECVKESRELIEEDHIGTQIKRNESDSKIEVYACFISDYKEALGTSNFRCVEKEAKELLNTNGYEVEEDSIEFKKTCRELLRAKIQLLEYHVKLLYAEDTIGAENYLHPSVLLKPDNNKTTVDDSKKISEELEAFIRNKVVGKGLSGNSQTAYRDAVKDLIFVLGDVPVNTITYDNAEEFVRVIQKLPKNRNRITCYKDKSKADFLEMDIPDVDRISATTADNKLTGIKTIFRWLEAKGAIDKSPFTTLTVQRNETSYPRYQIEDLIEIFNSDLYQKEGSYRKRKTTTASHWWLPLLALFSGARISELVQMRVVDVKEIEGVVVATVTDEDEEMRVKTKAGKRLFPVHPILIQLGIREYLDKLKGEGAGRVLAGFKLGGRTPGEYAGKWWRESYRVRYLPDCFKGRRLVFHSFRSTYITEALQNAQIPLDRVQQVVGHEREQMGATAIYDKGASLPQLLEEVQKIRYDGLDLSGLKGGWESLTLL